MFTLHHTYIWITKIQSCYFCGSYLDWWSHQSCFLDFFNFQGVSWVSFSLLSARSICVTKNVFVAHKEYSTWLVTFLLITETDHVLILFPGNLFLRFWLKKLDLQFIIQPNTYHFFFSFNRLLIIYYWNNKWLSPFLNAKFSEKVKILHIFYGHLKKCFEHCVVKYKWTLVQQ